MKRIKIKDWVHAIDLTIERHQAVIDEKYSNYIVAKFSLRPKNWSEACPLCAYLIQLNNKKRFSKSLCNKCLWIKFENERCYESDKYDYNNDSESIRRLKRWKKRLLKTNNKQMRG